MKKNIDYPKIKLRSIFIKCLILSAIHHRPEGRFTLGSGKAQWKQFFELFLYGGHNPSPGQLKKIISIRKEYNLPTLGQEIKLQKALEVKEESFGIFDIKRHEQISISSWKDPYKKEFEIIENIIKHANNVKEDKLAHNS